MQTRATREVAAEGAQAVSEGFDIDLLEADLGPAARLRVLANVGGQRRPIPFPANAATSKLAKELGVDIAIWLAGRHGGDVVVFPSPRAREAEAGANALRAAILEAGLIEPSRSANDIASEFGVTERWVTKVRSELRAGQCSRQRQPDLFD